MDLNLDEDKIDSYWLYKFDDLKQISKRVRSKMSMMLKRWWVQPIYENFTRKIVDDDWYKLSQYTYQRPGDKYVLSGPNVMTQNIMIDEAKQIVGQDKVLGPTEGYRLHGYAKVFPVYYDVIKDNPGIESGARHFTSGSKRLRSREIYRQQLRMAALKQSGKLNKYKQSGLDAADTCFKSFKSNVLQPIIKKSKYELVSNFLNSSMVHFGHSFTAGQPWKSFWLNVDNHIPDIEFASLVTSRLFKYYSDLDVWLDEHRDPIIKGKETWHLNPDFETRGMRPRAGKLSRREVKPNVIELWEDIIRTRDVQSYIGAGHFNSLLKEEETMKWKVEFLKPKKNQLFNQIEGGKIWSKLKNWDPDDTTAKDGVNWQCISGYLIPFPLFITYHGGSTPITASGIGGTSEINTKGEQVVAEEEGYDAFAGFSDDILFKGDVPDIPGVIESDELDNQIKRFVGLSIKYKRVMGLKFTQDRGDKMIGRNSLNDIVGFTQDHIPDRASCASFAIVNGLCKSIDTFDVLAGVEYTGGGSMADFVTEHMQDGLIDQFEKDYGYRKFVGAL